MSRRNRFNKPITPPEESMVDKRPLSEMIDNHKTQSERTIQEIEAELDAMKPDAFHGDAVVYPAFNNNQGTLKLKEIWAKITQKWDDSKESRRQQSWYLWVAVRGALGILGASVIAFVGYMHIMGFDAVVPVTNKQYEQLIALKGSFILPNNTLFVTTGNDLQSQNTYCSTTAFDGFEYVINAFDGKLSIDTPMPVPTQSLYCAKDKSDFNK